MSRAIKASQIKLYVYEHVRELLAANASNSCSESAALITSMAKQVITLFILLHVMAAPPPPNQLIPHSINVTSAEIAQLF